MGDSRDWTWVVDMARKILNKNPTFENPNMDLPPSPLPNGTSSAEEKGVDEALIPPLLGQEGEEGRAAALPELIATQTLQGNCDEEGEESSADQEEEPGTKKKKKGLEGALKRNAFSQPIYTDLEDKILPNPNYVGTPLAKEEGEVVLRPCQVALVKIKESVPE